MGVIVIKQLKSRFSLVAVTKMKQLKLGISLMVMFMMSAVLAPAAMAQALTEFVLVLPWMAVDTNAGPASFTASTDIDDTVTGHLRFSLNDVMYPLAFDTLDGYILDETTRERVGVRLSGQASTSDQGPADATLSVFQNNSGTLTVTITITPIETGGHLDPGSHFWTQLTND